MCSTLPKLLFCLLGASLSRGLAEHPELGAARPRVLRALFWRWADRSPDLLGLACFESLPKESLHYAVFERVERDHDEAPAGGEALKPHCESSLEIVELIVDSDAQGLEDARRRMNARRAAHGRRDTLLNDSYKLCRRLDGMLATLAHDILSDARRPALLPVVTEDLRQLALVKSVDKIRSRQLLRRIKTHI
jgi:hypothetical protein